MGIEAAIPSAFPQPEALLSVRGVPRRIEASRGRRVTLRLRVLSDGVTVSGAYARFAGKTATTDAQGRALLQVRFRRSGPRVLVVAAAGRRTTRRRVNVQVRARRADTAGRAPRSAGRRA